MASIERRTTGRGESRWDVRYRAAGREVSRTFRSRADAVAFRRQVEHDELRGVAYDPRAGRIPLAEWWERWWPSTVNLRQSTRERDETIYRTRIAPAFGETTLDKINREALRVWVAELRGELAPTTVHKCVQIIAKTLRAAVEDGRLARNPADRLDLPPVKGEEMRFLTPDEIATLAETIPPTFRALVYLGAYGGLRLGEMLALRARHVDIIRRRVEVHTTVYELASGELIENPPKTSAGRRSVPLPRVAVDALACHARGCAPDARVFVAAEGGTVRARAWRRRVWQPAVRASGLDALRPHDLRHTAVALWIAAGASPKEIAARAGHTSVVTVLDRYGHLLPGTEERVTDALDDVAEAARPIPNADVVPLARDSRGME